MSINNDKNIDITGNETNPFLSPAPIGEQETKANAIALKVLSEYPDLFANPFEKAIDAVENEPYQSTLTETPEEEDFPPLPTIPEEAIIPKGEKARKQLLEQLKNPDIMMDTQTMTALYKGVEAKLNRPASASLVDRIIHSTKKVLTNIFTKRGDQLSEIKQLLLVRINAERKRFGPASLRNVIAKLNNDPNMMNDGMAFRLRENSKAVQNWMSGFRDEKEFDRMSTGEKVGVAYRLCRENLLLEEYEINITDGDIVDGKLKDEVGEKVRAKMYENNPDRKDLFQFLHKLVNEENQNGLDPHSMALSWTASIIPKRTLISYEYFKLFEWLVENPG